MLASFPASMVNQNRSDLGILNRFNLTPSPAEQEGEAGPLPEFLTDEEEQTSDSDEDRRRLI